MAKKFLKVRDEHILPILQASLAEYNENGWPMIRPMWWLEPDDQDAYLINDQFAIGDDVIVAPVLEQGVRQRDIYLPSGWWRDDSAQIMRGGKWVRKYQVDLDKVPYFKRTDPNA
ncbi:putative family 31 glucosidase KIAA1161-like protein [Leptotrombidium deliense]|uniref:Putative family 31 glucosidase KIAA1161-like protein n=1 Tax=Leptotrombidium deliense TaxID=299467 RepID=A0A443RT22_9ACAR|nr:putative family 31 glucosidase KIAA1161-like protein [Leptotrombidium deliense]